MRNGKVVIHWGWEAQTRQQVQDHINAAVYSISLDGKPLRNFQMGDIEHDSEKDTYLGHWFEEFSGREIAAEAGS